MMDTSLTTGECTGANDLGSGVAWLAHATTNLDLPVAVEACLWHLQLVKPVYSQWALYLPPLTRLTQGPAEPRVCMSLLHATVWTKPTYLVVLQVRLFVLGTDS